MTRVLVITSDDSVPLHIVEWDGSLDAIQALVGGLIEAVSLPHLGGHTLYCDEEGKLKYAPFNARATYLFHRGADNGLDIIVGDAVLAGPVDSEGNDTDVRFPFTDMGE